MTNYDELISVLKENKIDYNSIFPLGFETVLIGDYLVRFMGNNVAVYRFSGVEIKLIGFVANAAGVMYNGDDKEISIISVGSELSLFL